MGDLVEHRLGRPLLMHQVFVVPGDQVTLLQNRGLQAAQAVHGVDLGRQDQGVIGLGQKVIAAGVQALGQGFAFAQRREEDDRHQRLPRQLLDLPRGFKAIHDRHQCVHQHQLRTLAGKHLNRFGAIADSQRLMALAADDARQQQAVGGAVFGDQDGQRLQDRGQGAQLISNSLSKLEMARILRTSLLLLITLTSASSPPA